MHPERGANLVADIVFLKPVAPYCLYHHERYDGKGYPYGKRGEDIPIEGRLMAVADAFDAMTSHRPNRRGLDPEVAIRAIEQGKGTQFDPACADALVACYREGKIAQILQSYDTDERSIACPFCSTFIRIPENVRVNDVVSCQVCWHRVRLRERNAAYFGELVGEREQEVRVDSAGA
ncbi:MAG TPA: HD domain-containing protein [Candidatus Hydrogenedentes bacterium]|nr:HD domain-containing protein [Candidatus Hydrogenedentota bacterium]